jgi:hypothetical protein
MRKSTNAGVLKSGLALIAILTTTQFAFATTDARRALAATAKMPVPPISRQADRVLQEMGAYIGSANQFTFHADITFDHVLPSGQKLQFSSSEDVVEQRPNLLYVEWNGDLGARQFWYDGKSITLYDTAQPFYASGSASGGIDGMLESAINTLGFSPPLADFLYRDPYKAVRRNIQFGFDLGQNTVNGRNCRTLAFVEKDIDWQIWIENGPRPTPCKLVITYKTRPSQPQFAAVFSDWDFAPHIAAPVFTPDLPTRAQKVPFANISAAK